LKIDWKLSQLNAMALSMNLRSILHIPGHGRPDFPKETSILLSISSENAHKYFHQGVGPFGHYF
jgi:hypothetical protein